MARVALASDNDNVPPGLSSPEKAIANVDIVPICDNPPPQIQAQVVRDNGPGRRIVEVPIFDPDSGLSDYNNVHPVSLLDCIMPRILVPVTLTYQLDDDAESDDIIAKITEGLRRLIQEDYRFLAGAVFEPVADGERPYTRLPASPTAALDVHIQDLTMTDPAFPAFAELKAQHFPPALVDGRMLPHPFDPSPVPVPGEGVPALRVQLNLIRGGLVMGVAVHHILADALGLDKLLARWAAHTRSASSSRPRPPAPLQPRDLDRRAFDVDGRCCHDSEAVVDYRQQAVASLKYAPDAGPTSDMPASAMEAHIWHIPASKLAALKATAAAPDDGTGDHQQQQQQQWVSTNDCITALMWRAVTRARLARHGVSAADTRTVALENSLDVRSAFASPPVSAGYVGNVVMFSKAEMALAELVRSDDEQQRGSFRAVAVKVRQAVQAYRATATVRRAMQWIAACPRGAAVEMDFAAIGGLDFVTTSWRVLGAYGDGGGFGFGPLQALRWATAVFDGYCFLYPTRRSSGGPDEGVEIYLGLERACMQRLLLDAELAVWAEVRN